MTIDSKIDTFLTLLERLIVAAEKIAGAHGTPALEQVQTEDPPKRGPGRSKKAEKPQGHAAPEPVQAALPTEIPQTENLFGADDEASAPEHTAQDVKNIITLALKHMPQDKVAEIFKANNGGVPNVSAMQPELYGKVIDAFQTILEKM